MLGITRVTNHISSKKSGNRTESAANGILIV
jgi:hypothetical protein